MTTHEIGQRAPSRHARRKRRRNYGPVIILALVCAAIFAAGYCVGVSAADKAVPTLPEPVLESTATPEPSAEPSVAPTPSPTTEAVLWRDDIVTDGNLLDYDLQVTMQACCEEYGVPYALALAVADVESRFDPDAASSTNDYGLMQINQVNHGWLLEQGIDPMTPAGNIEAGVLFLSDYLTAYGDPELAVMAYNCGPSGAQNLWAAGTYSTDHSRKVMDRFDYRVRSYDSYNATSTYVTSETRTVDNNAIPVITSSTTSGTDLGTKEDGFDLTYTVTDADNDTVTVKEYLDNVLKRTYTATLGQSNTVQCVTAANWQKVLNGAHTIKVVANDTKADSTPYTVTFTKAVYEASITLAEPMDADDAITVMVLNVLGSIPADADLEVLVTNNANDTEPVWEDATQDVKNGNNHVFTNQTAANGFAFNFKVNVGRGASNTGGYITSIGGAFQ